MWRCDFKYNDELTLVFMSSNQIGGFFNRLEASRKHLFGSMGVLGGADGSVISGVFIARGDDIKLSVDCAPDWESYEYKRLDLMNDSDKKYFEDALAWDLELGGKKWAVGKNVGRFKCVDAEELQAAASGKWPSNFFQLFTYFDLLLLIRSRSHSPSFTWVLTFDMSDKNKK